MQEQDADAILFTEAGTESLFHTGFIIVRSANS